MELSTKALASAVRTGVVLCLALAVVPPTQAARKGGRAFARMSPAEFAELPEVNAPIDLAHYDRDLMAAAIFHETNRWRHKLGLPSFKHQEKLDQAADVQATFGSLMPSIGHLNQLPSQATPLARVVAVGYKPGLVAENVALTSVLNTGTETSFIMEGEGPAKKFINPSNGRELQPHSYSSFAANVLVLWMNSPGHRANIANRGLRNLGCSARSKRGVNGIESLFSVQEFFTPGSASFR